MKAFSFGPVMHKLMMAESTIECLSANKHWLARGNRAAAVAAQLILNKNIIAVPTDTIYGLAGLAQCDEAIEKLYTIKKRDLSKPISICLWNINDIKNYAEVSHLPKDLLQNLLPGATTVLLERKTTVNPNVNAGLKNIGIRIPQSGFLLCVARMVNQPLALTSANISQDKSTLHPSEFEHLWPELKGVFYNRLRLTRELDRTGSTVVDLSVKGEFKITRKGKNYKNIENILNIFNIKNKEDTEINQEDKCAEEAPVDNEVIKACATK